MPNSPEATDSSQDANAPDGAYDHARRRKAKRSGRERGCWTYIPATELANAGLGDHEGDVFYRVWGQPRGSVQLRLYREA